MVLVVRVEEVVEELTVLDEEVEEVELNVRMKCCQLGNYKAIVHVVAYLIDVEVLVLDTREEVVEEVLAGVVEEDCAEVVSEAMDEDCGPNGRDIEISAMMRGTKENGSGSQYDKVER